VAAAGVLIIPDDLACGVDAGCNRGVGSQGIVERGVAINRHIRPCIAYNSRRITARYFRGRQAIRADLGL